MRAALKPVIGVLVLAAIGVMLVGALGHMLIAVFGGLAAWTGWQLVALNRGLALPAFEFSLGWPYASAVAGGILIVLFALATLTEPAGHDPMSVRLPMSLRFAQVGPMQQARYNWPYLLALLIGPLLIICVPQLSLVLPRSSGFVH